MYAVHMSVDITLILSGHKHVNIIVNLLQNKNNFHRREELCSTLSKQIVESVGQHKLATTVLRFKCLRVSSDFALGRL